MNNNVNSNENNADKNVIKCEKHSRTKTIAIVALAVLLAVAIAVGVTLGVTANNYMLETQGFYSKSYSQLVMDVNNLDSELSKLLILNSDEAREVALNEVSSIALSAGNSLENLPISQNGVSKLNKYFNQLMDYTKHLSKKIAKNDKLSEEEFEMLNKLYSINMQLKKSINEGYDSSLNEKNGSYSKGLFMNLQYIDPLDITYESMSESSFEYPTMIYDGPFSDAKKRAENDKGEVNFDLASAKEIATKFVKDVKNLQLMGGESQEQTVYSFGGEKNGESVFIQVSKQNGKVVLYDMYREIGGNNLSKEQGIEKAKAFLNENGYEGVELVWKDVKNNVLMLNFAYVKDDVVMYCDLVKVKVALDDGQIVGLEGLEYTNNLHKQHETKAKLTVEQAREKVNKKLQIQTSRLAIIPIDETDVLAYEFSGQFEDMTFYVYIDAMSGKEVNTLRVIRGTEGELVL